MPGAAQTDRPRAGRSPPGANAGRRIVVAGGGIGGLAAALSFARRGARVTLLEQAPALTEVGAGLQVTPNGGAVLRALGLGDAVLARGLRAAAVEPVDALTGHRIACFDLSALPGAPYVFLHRADLIDILATACRAAGVELRTGTRVARISPAGEVRSEAGVLNPVLAVGAEGLHSDLRRTLNGGDAPFFTGQVAWRAIVRAEAPPVARIWMAPGRHVVTYPLPGGRLNLVAVQERAAWAAEGWHHEDDPAHLRAAFADACPELQGLLALVAAPRLWGLFRHPVAAHWVAEGAAILGDAAHPTLPFLAQGANLALEDAWVLAACCDARQSLGEALGRYEALRRPRVQRAIAAANANAVNYHLSGWRRGAAHGALGLLGRLAPGAFLRRMDWLYGHDVTQVKDAG